MVQHILLPKDRGLLLAEEVGLHIGDGSMNYYRGKGFYQLRGHLIDDKSHYLERVAFLYKELFNIKVSLREMPATGVFGFQVWSDELIAFKHTALGLPLGKKTYIQIPPFILQDREAAKAFLRGLFDTDGCLYVEKKRGNPYPRVQITNVSKELIEQLKTMLTELGYRWSCHVYPRKELHWNEVSVVCIRGHAMTHRWFSDIRPQNPKHVRKYLSYARTTPLSTSFAVASVEPGRRRSEPVVI